MEKYIYISTGQILYDYICLHFVLVAICNFT